MSVLALALACSLAAPLQVTSPVYTDPGEVPQLRVAADKTPLPLEHTAVKADITGFVARVEVKQIYSNPSKNPLEAIYVFPLPENSAVDDMRIRIGDREIRAEIKKRDEARQTYETAKQQGHTAALLEQERPNIFTQSVANIAPGTKIEVTVSYVQTLTYDAGTYEMVFPMVVGPRYKGHTPDIARISPPYFGEGERNGHDISMEVTVHPGFPILSHDVPTHETVAEKLEDGGLRLKLAAHDKLPNRDFVLHYEVAGKLPQLALLTHGNGKDGEFALVLQPAKMDVDKLVGKREIIFVVDVSGSMHGVPLAMCKDAMREALRKLRPMDTFNVLVFASRTGQAFSEPIPANDANVLEGMKYIDGLTAGGGTEMADAVDAALRPSVERDRHRYVFFLTDGYVGNEQQILDRAATLVAKQKDSKARARVFGFGVGSSVNRFLLDGLGKAGEGATVYATTREDPVVAVNTFFRLIDAPIMENLQIDWGNAKVTEVYPTRIPDLFASRPTIIHGRFEGKADTTITVRGESQGRILELTAKANMSPSAANDNLALGSLWARSKVESLERDLWSGHDQKVVDKITEVGLSHRLVTAYTSFVAVDTATKVDGKLQTVVQPVHAPEGVDLSMAGGEYAAKSKGRTHGGPAGGASYGSGYGGGALGGVSGIGRGAALERKPAKVEPLTVAPSTRREANELREDEEVVAKAPRDDKADAAPMLVVASGLDKAAVARVLDAGKAQLEAVLAKAGFKGSITLRWFVTAQGTAIQVKLERGKLDAATLKELATLITAMKFPAATQGSPRVDYTLTR